MKTKQEQFKEKLIKLLEDEIRESEGNLSYVAFAVSDFCIEVSRKLDEEFERLASESGMVH